MKFAVQAPQNNLSFGQVTMAILREFYKKGLEPTIFQMGNKDISAQKDDPEFNKWLAAGEQKVLEHNRKDPVVRLWHGNLDSLSQVSEKQILLTFHECSALTPVEVNILSQQAKVLVTSQYTKQVFETYGLTNVVYCPLGFDTHNFYSTTLGKEPGVTQWLLAGKLEGRKATLRVLNLWAQMYGNNPAHRLHCLIFNPFIDPKQQEAMIAHALGGQRVWNIGFRQHLKTNFEVNQLLNFIDVDLTGLSYCEGFNLIPFHSMCLGKWPVFLNEHVHKDYATENNSILVPSNGFQKAVDNIFFREGEPFNQGYWHNWSDEAAVAALKQAEKKVGTVNTEGIKVKEIFTYTRSVDIILEELNKL